MIELGSFVENLVKMYKIGDIRRAKELGYKDTHKYIYQSCDTCGNLRWVKLIKNKPESTRCIKCNNNDPSRRETIKLVWTGRKHRKESRQKMSNTRFGKKLSDSHRKSISEGLKGNKFAWKGGRTPIQQLVRTIREYREWRTSVFDRDKYTCQKCNSVGGKLNAHHKKSFSLILEENDITNTYEAVNCNILWDTDNGITLCEFCHKEIRNGERI